MKTPSVILTFLLTGTLFAEDTKPILERGAKEWRYLDTGSAPPDGWTKPDFDDSKWKSGQAPLGYGERDIATTISFGDDPESKHAVAYFRRKIHVEDPSSSAYAGLIRADDGAVIHLNGKETHRMRVPAGAIDHKTFSEGGTRSESGLEGELLHFEIKPECLTKGENTLCVSVHQRHGASSDLVLDMEILTQDAYAALLKREAPKRALDKKVAEYLKTNRGLTENVRANIINREQTIEGLKWMFELEGAEPNETAEARAQRAMKAASKIMTDAGKLKAKQATELYAIVFPEDIDWDAKYEAYLKENPGVARAVDSGKITKEKVMAGIKARSGEKAPTEEEQLEALYHKLLKDEPNLGRTPKVDLMPRLKRMLERGEGKNLRPEKTTRQRGMTFGLYFNNLIESGQVERSDKDMQLVFDIGASEISRQEEGEREDRVGERRIDEERRDRTDWEAKYKAYVEGNPSVAKAVETGKISKEKVMAGIKARAAEAWEAKLKRFWEYEKRDDPRRWVGKTFEQVRRELEQMLREEPDGWERDNEEDQRERGERERGEREPGERRRDR